MLRIISVLWYGLIFGRLPPKRCAVDHCSEGPFCIRARVDAMCMCELCPTHCRAMCLCNKTRIDGKIRDRAEILALTSGE